MTKQAEDEIDERYMVPGLSRGLALLQLFTRERPAQSLAELAAGLGLTRSAAYRLVYTLEKERFLARDAATRRYRLTSKVLTLGFDYLHAQGIIEQAQPFLRALSDKTRAASYVIILDGWESVYLARIAPPAVGLVSNLQVGMRLPAHVTASGRILLAHLSENDLREVYRRLQRECKAVPPPASFAELKAQAEADRRRGYVYSASLFGPGSFSMACAVRDSSGGAVAAVNVLGPQALFDQLGGETVLRGQVGDAIGALSERLGFTG